MRPWACIIGGETLIPSTRGAHLNHPALLNQTVWRQAVPIPSFARRQRTCTTMGCRNAAVVMVTLRHPGVKAGTAMRYYCGACARELAPGLRPEGVV